MIVFEQREFFRLVQEELGPQVNLANWLIETIQVPRSTAYKRLRAESMLTVPELLTIAAKCPRSVQMATDMFRPQPLRLFRINQFNNVEDFDVYLSRILKQFETLGKAPDFAWDYVARDWPIFYFLSHPLVLRFKLSIWTGRPRSEGLISLPKATTDKAASLWNLYRELPTQELWDPMNTSKQMAMVEQEEENGFLLATDAHEIRQVYSNLMAELKVAIQKGEKSKGGQLQLYSSPDLTMNNGSRLKANGQPIILGALHNAQHYDSTDPSVIDLFDRLWKRHLETATKITNAAPAVQERFWEGMSVSEREGSV